MDIALGRGNAVNVIVLAGTAMGGRTVNSKSVGTIVPCPKTRVVATLATDGASVTRDTVAMIVLLK